MGKKGKGGQQQKKKKEAELEVTDDLLEQLSNATKNNANLAHGPAKSEKELKKERKEKAEFLKTEKVRIAQEKAEAEAKSRQQLQQFMDIIRKQQMMQSDYLEEPVLDKDVHTCEDDEYMVTSVGMQGWRRGMEDAHLVQLPNKDDGVAMFGVFDGHSGDEVAKYAGANLDRVVRAQEEFKEKNYEAALSKGFMALDKEMQEKEMASGSTATICLVAGGNIYCANAGDSRAAMSQNKLTVELSEDHKPMLESERARIEKAGSTVEDVNGIGRVNGMLAVSRGFGDFKMKAAEGVAPEEQAVTAFPEIKKFSAENVEYLVVACDGIWDCLTSEQVIEQTKDAASATTPDQLTNMTTTIMDSIVAKRPSMYGSDNMSVVLVQFKKNRA